MAVEYEITGHTRFGGLLGYPVAHSISPQMHNYSFRRLGIDAVYLCFSVLPEQLGETVRTFRNLDCFGFNLTMPDKTAVLEYLDELSPAARMIGAVNTVVNDHGRLIGTSTDGQGYMESLKDAGIDIIGKKITVLGAGGAATAIAMQAGLDGVSEISIFNRQDEFWERALENAEKLNKKTGCRAAAYQLEDTEALRREIADSVLLANGTSCGFAEQVGLSPVPDESFLRPDLIVTDAIYVPEQTALLEMAERVGCRTLNGVGMMLYQGAAAFKIWTGREMPVDLVKEVL